MNMRRLSRGDGLDVETIIRDPLGYMMRRRIQKDKSEFLKKAITKDKDKVEVSTSSSLGLGLGKDFSRTKRVLRSATQFEKLEKSN